MKIEGYSLNSLVDYMDYLDTEFKTTTKLYPNRMYTYDYKFSQDYPYKELKFYDWKPLVYIFEIRGKYAIGMNFHHIPPKARQIWFDRVEKLSKRLDNNIRIKGLGGRPVYKIHGLNYPRVYQVLQKSKISIRKYRFDRMSNVRDVDLRKFREVSSFFANTYFDVDISDIRKRYNIYKPK